MFTPWRGIIQIHSVLGVIGDPVVFDRVGIGNIGVFTIDTNIVVGKVTMVNSWFRITTDNAILVAFGDSTMGDGRIGTVNFGIR